MRKIELSGERGKGKYLIIDDFDYDKVSKRSWHYSNKSAATSINNKNTSISSFLLGKKKGMDIDHINGDRLDNRRTNLRHCTREENNRNRRIQKNNKSGYKGVFFHKGSNKWLAVATKNRKAVYGKMRMSPQEAFEDYKVIAKGLFGDFARF